MSDHSSNHNDRNNKRKDKNKTTRMSDSDPQQEDLASSEPQEETEACHETSHDTWTTSHAGVAPNEDTTPPVAAPLLVSSSIPPALSSLPNSSSSIPSDSSLTTTTTSSTTAHFPLLLHAILTKAESDRYSHICHWKSHGRSFCVLDRDLFVTTIMPLYFRQSQFASFQRQLNLYGFERLSRKYLD